MATKPTRAPDSAPIVGDVEAAFVYPFTIAVARERSRSPWFSMPDLLDGAVISAIGAHLAGRRYGQGSPDSRRGLLPFLALDDWRKTFYVETQDQKTELIGKHTRLPATFTTCVRVSNTGAGTATFSIHPDRVVTAREASELFALAPNTHGELPGRLRIGGRRATLFDMFRTEVRALVGAFRRAAYRAAWIEYEGDPSLNGHKYRLIPKAAIHGGYATTPYLVLRVTIDEETYQHLQTPLAGGRLADAVAPLMELLLGIQRPEWGWNGDEGRRRPDVAALRRIGALTADGRVDNLNLLTVPCVLLGPKVCLVIGVDARGESERLMQRSVLDCIELLRMQWHFYVLAHAILDHETDNLTQHAPSRAELERFVLLRRNLTNIMENIEVFRWGGNAVGAIYDRANDVYDLDKLRDTALVKLRLLRDLYDDVREIERERQYAAFAETRKGRRAKS